MEKLIEDLVNHTDCYPWYWFAYGEKDYGFAVVEAFPINEDDIYPDPGSELQSDEDENGKHCWSGKNGTKMIIETYIADIEKQNGGTICSFIAGVHAELMKDHITTQQSE